MKNMKKRSLRRIFAGILGIGILLTGAAPCAAAAYGYDEYGDPIVTATPVPDGQAAAVTPAHSSYYSQAADTPRSSLYASTSRCDADNPGPASGSPGCGR